MNGRYQITHSLIFQLTHFSNLLAFQTDTYYFCVPFSEGSFTLAKKNVDTLSYKTISANAATVEKKWFVVDAGKAPLGRLCSDIASVLRGKHKTSFTPHVDCGDNVIVVNADQLVLTGKKMDNKVYIRHTGYPGGQRFSTPRQEMAKSSARVIEKAVRGMLPKNKLGRKIFKNLYVYTDAEHPHEAQQPQPLQLK